MSDKSEISVVVYGTATLKELPVLAGVGEIDNADIEHHMEHGETVTLDTEPPLIIEVRSP